MYTNEKYTMFVTFRIHIIKFESLEIVWVKDYRT